MPSTHHRIISIWVTAVTHTTHMYLRSYFDEAWRNAQKTAPVVIHNNWITGSDAKKQRFIDAGLWYKAEKKSKSSRPEL